MDARRRFNWHRSGLSIDKLDGNYGGRLCPVVFVERSFVDVVTA